MVCGLVAGEVPVPLLGTVNVPLSKVDLSLLLDTFFLFLMVKEEMCQKAYLVNTLYLMTSNLMSLAWTSNNPATKSCQCLQR